MEYKNEIRNNTKIAQEVIWLKDITENPLSLRTMKDRSIHTAVDFTMVENAPKELRKLSYLDLCVLDAIYTLAEMAGDEAPVFTVESVIRIMTGNQDWEYKVTEAKKRAVEAEIKKMSMMRMTIDATMEMRERGEIEEGEEFVVDGYVLPVERATYVPKNKRRVSAYKLLQKETPYWRYMKANRQMVSLPLEIIKAIGNGVQENIDTVILKQYLMMRVARMKRNEGKMNVVSYFYEKSVNGERMERGLMPLLGYSKSSFSSEANWRKKKAVVHGDVIGILEAMKGFVDGNGDSYINGYEVVKDGNSVTGVRIDA